MIDLFSSSHDRISFDLSPDFMSQVEERASRLNTRVCVGIDPHPEFVSDVGSLEKWCIHLAKQTAPFAACFKLNIAFFESFGAEGMRVLERVQSQISPLAPLLLDAKRGDISSTADAYATAAFEHWGAQGLTVSPYLGLDSIEPYLKYPQSGLFVLCHTSNPSAASVQRHGERFQDTERESGKEPKSGQALYERIVEILNEHPERERVGFVVGATQPEAVRVVRAIAPKSWLLCPGVGAQGGDVNRLISEGWGETGRVLVASSRAIARAHSPAEAAKQLRDQIRQAATDYLAALTSATDYLAASTSATGPDMVLKSEVSARPIIKTPSNAMNHSPKNDESDESDDITHRLAKSLLEAGCVLFGDFTLKSGLQSPIYFDLRRLTGHLEAFTLAITAYHHRFESLVDRHHFDALAALPLAGLPLATGLALRLNMPLCYPRPPKAHGTKVSIEGGLDEGRRLLMIDDLATKGVSATEALMTLRADNSGARHIVHDLLVLIDRESGAERALAQHQVTLHSALKVTDLLNIWESLMSVPAHQIQAARRFIQESHR